MAHACELGYAACLALCEQSNESHNAAFQTDYYASLKRLGIVPDEVFEPYQRHALTEVEPATSTSRVCPSKSEARLGSPSG